MRYPPGVIPDLGPYRRILRRELRGAQECLCPYCGGWLPRGLRNTLNPEYPTLEHVRPAKFGREFKRTPGAKSARASSLMRNALLVHGRCNKRKDNRDPTACELIWLEAVNVQIEWLWRTIERQAEALDRRSHLLALATELDDPDEIAIDPDPLLGCEPMKRTA
jgi:hypothetical protein